MNWENIHAQLDPYNSELWRKLVDMKSEVAILGAMIRPRTPARTLLEKVERAYNKLWDALQEITHLAEKKAKK